VRRAIGAPYGFRVRYSLADSRFVYLARSEQKKIVSPIGNGARAGAFNADVPTHLSPLTLESVVEAWTDLWVI
jgi:hypothetical protein